MPAVSGFYSLYLEVRCAHASSFQEGTHVMKEMTGCGLTWLVRDSLLKEMAFLSGSETHLGAFEGSRCRNSR